MSEMDSYINTAITILNEVEGVDREPLDKTIEILKAYRIRLKSVDNSTLQ